MAPVASQTGRCADMGRDSGPVGDRRLSPGRPVRSRGRGRSPALEIRRVRIERAKQLLATTGLPIPKVAEASGCGTGEYLATLFRPMTGITPLKYRATTHIKR